MNTDAKLKPATCEDSFYGKHVTIHVFIEIIKVVFNRYPDDNLKDQPESGPYSDKRFAYFKI